jgi:hypothetical protein
LFEELACRRRWFVVAFGAARASRFLEKLLRALTATGWLADVCRHCILCSQFFNVTGNFRIGTASVREAIQIRGRRVPIQEDRRANDFFRNDR